MNSVGCDQNLNIFPNHDICLSTDNAALLGPSDKVAVGLLALCAPLPLAHAVSDPEVPGHTPFSGGAQISTSFSRLQLLIFPGSLSIADLDVLLEDTGVSGGATLPAAPAPARELASAA